tara:strand:- start:11295 stop:12065 length:771 start_codon:yes stop_codon:yes gene_type:complete
MKKSLVIFFFLSYLICNSQTTGILKRTIELDNNTFVGCDYNLNYYYFNKTIFYKSTDEKSINYSNYLYGEISTVDISNPLKIVVFYKDFNIVVLLDSQLNETDVIQLPYDVSFVTKGTANHLWLFTTNTRIIENYNFKTNSVVSASQPLKNTSVLNMKSTENYVYLHTNTGIQTFDYLGNFIHAYKSEQLEDFQYSNRVLYTLSKDTIYQIKGTRKPFLIPSISNIKKFYTLNNHFFIFDNAQLYLFLTERNNVTY